MDNSIILRAYLVNLEISFCRLAGNSLILYLNCQPGEDKGFIIWIEPTWHFANQTEVLLGSRQAQVETDEELQEVFEPLKQLLGKKIKNLIIEVITNDLTIQFDEFSIKSFVADPTDDHTWHVIDNEKRRRFKANPKEMTVYNCLCTKNWSLVKQQKSRVFSGLRRHQERNPTHGNYTRNNPIRSI
ncbi:hypothetical protein [Paenibacillus sp. MBLB4367]|uniref:hypothetical protein n=1 Tax=Paenibacillus sp. MBLB4367 TaxID=3384767 RepID=UPI0039084147